MNRKVTLVKAYPTRKVVKCRAREGLQVAIEQGLTVHCIMTNGLVITFETEKQELEWKLEYEYLCGSSSRQWREQQWNSHGFTLVCKTHSAYKRSRVMPRLIVQSLTIS